MGRPSFSPPPRKQRLHVYLWQGKVGCVFPRQLQFTICTTVFPHPITIWTRLILNLVRVGKKWLIRCLLLSVWRISGPAQFFPSPSTKYNWCWNMWGGEKTDRVEKKLTGYFFLPGKKLLVSFFPGEEMGQPDPSPGKDWRGKKLTVTPGWTLLCSQIKVWNPIVPKVGWLCWGLTSQSTIFQSCRDG